MNNTIHIPEPCSEKWTSMKDIGNRQRHCEVCKTNVHDFTKSSLSEINKKLKAANGQKLCGNYHERHIKSSEKTYVFVNYLEKRLVGMRLKKFSLILITLVLFLSGCARKHTKGKYRALSHGNDKKKYILVNESW
jgi:hypothetical protein